MIIRRKHNSRFTVVPNEPINDEALTFEALGLLTYLLSRPDNWQVHLSQLRSRGGLGRDKAQKLMRQLIDAGYVVRRQARAENSKQFQDYEYVVYDCPQAQKDEAKPEPENPVAEGRRVNFDMPENFASPEALSQIHANVLKSVAEGELSLDEGKEISCILENQRRIIETTDIVTRLAKLEAAQSR